MQSVKEDSLSSCLTPFDPAELNELNEVSCFLSAAYSSCVSSARLGGCKAASHDILEKLSGGLPR